MKTLIAIVVLIWASVAAAGSGNKTVKNCCVLFPVTTNQISKVNSCSNLISKNAPIILVKQGCCSWHKGVCGCSKGRTVCCDGSLSPSCRC